ncbi:hypothetical protein [Pantoea coffeiphila]|uniref:hypothetical protein n=1 Tax=Pantoea coffeiphila TaxID=1465635 RepID=UPI001960B212|nr:hypothetical protein [Pantoea coffeiphila]MBM7344237.1 hypothetical protein [Pantoea coffeiphila]
MIIIPLSGEWEGGKSSRIYQIHIDEWAHWSKAKRTVIRKKLEATQENEQQNKVWIFSMGEQGVDN